MNIDLQIGLVGITLMLMVIHDFYFHRDVSWFFCNIAIRSAIAITLYFMAEEKWAVLACLSAFINPYRISKTMEAYFEKFFTSKFGDKPPPFDMSDSSNKLQTTAKRGESEHKQDKGDHHT